MKLGQSPYRVTNEWTVKRPVLNSRIDNVKVSEQGTQRRINREVDIYVSTLGVQVYRYGDGPHFAALVLHGGRVPRSRRQLKRTSELHSTKLGLIAEGRG